MNEFNDGELMNFSEMTIQKYVFLMLLFLSILMGLGVVVPSYLKIRESVWQEARNYALDRSILMRQKISQRTDVLNKAGVAGIDTYVKQAKHDSIRDIQATQDDLRVVRVILDKQGRVLLQSGADLSLRPDFLGVLEEAKDNLSTYHLQDGNWIVAVQEYAPWGWFVVSMMSEKAVYKESTQYLYYVLWVSGLVLIGVLVLYFLLTHHLRRRASSILTQLQLFGDGHYEKRLKVTGPGEFGVLQRGINSMIEHIEMEILSRKTVEQELNDAKLEAEQINLARAEYVADMSDQVRDSMNNVCGFSELLLKTDLDDQQKLYVKNVLESSQKLTALVDDVMDLSGIETDPEPLSCGGGEDLLAVHETLNSLEVLLISNDTMLTDYTSDVLNDYGAKVQRVDDETAAIKYLEDQDADLIFLDIDRSRLADDESIAYMRSNLSTYLGSIPILVMTAKICDQAASQYQRLGVTACITKPFNSSKLVNMVGDIVALDEPA